MTAWNKAGVIIGGFAVLPIIATCAVILVHANDDHDAIKEIRADVKTLQVDVAKIAAQSPNKVDLAHKNKPKQPQQPTTPFLAETFWAGRNDERRTKSN